MKYTVITLILISSASHGAFSILIDDNATLTSQLSSFASEANGDFGSAPATADNIASFTRSSTNATGFEYTIYNRDTLAEIDNINLLAAADGTISDLYLDTNATLDVENPVVQGGASLATFGYDSSGTGNNNSSGGVASRNAAVLDFGGAVSAFSADLLDFEASAGQEGLLVLGLNGNIEFSQPILFTDIGNNVIHNIGVLATSGMTFDTAVIILGDDNDTNLTNGYGGGEFWAVANVQVGNTIPEPSSALLIGIGGVIALTRRPRLQ